MSTETHVFFRGRLPSKQAFQKKLKELGFPFSVKPFEGSLEGYKGYLPLSFRRDETGVEFDVFDGRPAVEEFGDLVTDPALERVANFRWGGNFTEAVAGMCGAAALATLLHGVIFDEAEDRLLSAAEGVELARRNIAALAPPATKRQSAGQADLKRYLKPLLALRPDLALRGRFLMMGPVRHLMRGAWFESSSDPQSFYLNWFVQPLNHGEYAIVYDRVGWFHVTDRHFLSLLHYCLAHDVFDYVGRMTALDDYLALFAHPGRDARDVFIPLLLSRGTDSANAFINEHLGENPQPEWVRDYQSMLVKGPEMVFRQYHMEEAKAAKRAKIDHIWESASYPGEVSAPEEQLSANEMAFKLDPWPELARYWRAEMPAVKGEMRFADKTWWRSNESFLVGPIPHEEAERRHDASESYVFARRMEDDALLIVEHHAHTVSSPANVTQQPRRYVDRYLDITSASGLRLRARFYTQRNAKMRFSSVSIRNPRAGKEHWHALADDYRREISIWDSRGSEPRRSVSIMDDGELSAVASSEPAFDQYDAMLECVTSFLRRHRYGEFL